MPPEPFSNVRRAQAIIMHAALCDPENHKGTRKKHPRGPNLLKIELTEGTWNLICDLLQMIIFMEDPDA